MGVVGLYSQSKGKAEPVVETRVFTKSTTWTIPDGVTSVFVRIFGGGSNRGGGGNMNTGTFTVTPGSTVPITIGNASNTIAGNPSSFGSYITASGGDGGNGGSGAGGGIYSVGIGYYGGGGGAGDSYAGGGVGGNGGIYGGGGGGSGANAYDYTEWTQGGIGGTYGGNGGNGGRGCNSDAGKNNLVAQNGCAGAYGTNTLGNNTVPKDLQGTGSPGVGGLRSGRYSNNYYWYSGGGGGGGGGFGGNGGNGGPGQSDGRGGAGGGGGGFGSNGGNGSEVGSSNYTFGGGGGGYGGDGSDGIYENSSVRIGGAGGGYFATGASMGFAAGGGWNNIVDAYVPGGPGICIVEYIVK